MTTHPTGEAANAPLNTVHAPFNAVIALNETEAAVTNPKDMIDFANQKSRLDSLREDEQILDKLFDRTSYGKMIEAVGTSLAEALIEDISRGGDIDAAVKNLTDQIKEADVSPAVKQSAGRSR